MKVTLLIAFAVLVVIEAAEVGTKRGSSDQGAGERAGKKSRTDSGGSAGGKNVKSNGAAGNSTSTGAGGNKTAGVGKAPDDGMVPRPAVVSYSGCKLVPKTLAGCKSKGNPHIQMGEAWANPRVLNQRVAFFVPYKPGQPHYDSEGGPYGDVMAYDCVPNVTALAPSKNLAKWCFFWDGGLNGKADKTPIPKAPGEKAIPMPIVCPHNLNPCYSAKWFEPGGKLAKYGSMVPTYRGPWFPLKDKATSKPMFCQGLNLGCPTPTMMNLQLHRLASAKCDVSKCKPAPTLVLD